MPIAQAMWIHGNAARIEDPNQVSAIWRSGSFFRVVGKVSGRAWIHYSIPTPVIVTDHRLLGGSVMIRCRMFPRDDAWIEAVHVYDGERIIARHDVPDYRSSEWSFLRYEIPDTPEVLWGIGVSIKLAFTDVNYLGSQLREDVLRNAGLGLSDIESRIRGLGEVTTDMPSGLGGTGSGTPVPDVTVALPPSAHDLHYAVDISAVGCDFLT